MTTAREIIAGALRKIAVLGVGTSLPAEEADNALEALNMMIASWSTENLMIYVTSIETFDITAGDNIYTMGSGGDFATVRPNDIESAYVTFGGIQYNLDAIGSKEYASITDKSTQDIPQAFYYSNGYPLGMFRLYPVPSQSGTITIFTQKQLTEFASVNDDVDMPPEYKKALVYGLAVELAPEYEKEASFTVTREANRAKRNIKNQNSKNDINEVTFNQFFFDSGYCGLFQGSTSEDSGSGSGSGGGEGGGTTFDYIYVGTEQIYVGTEAVYL